MAIEAIQFPVFQRAMRIISSITNAYPAVITTTFDHQYQSGEIVRLVVPPGYGMTQANGQQGIITVNSDTTFLLDLDTTTYDAFAAPSTYPENAQRAQVVPIAEINSQLEGATQNVLPYSAT